MAGIPAQTRTKMAALTAGPGINCLVCRMDFGDLSNKESAWTATC